MRRREYGWLRRGLLSPVRTPHRKNREEPRPRGSQGFPCYGGKDNVCASALTLGSSSYEDEIAAGTVNKCTLTVSGHLLRNHSDRSEERRVGKKSRSRGAQRHAKKKKKNYIKTQK